MKTHKSSSVKQSSLDKTINTTYIISILIYCLIIVAAIIFAI